MPPACYARNQSVPTRSYDSSRFDNPRPYHPFPDCFPVDEMSPFQCRSVPPPSSPFPQSSHFQPFEESTEYLQRMYHSGPSYYNFPPQPSYANSQPYPSFGEPMHSRQFDPSYPPSLPISRVQPSLPMESYSPSPTAPMQSNPFPPFPPPPPSITPPPITPSTPPSASSSPPTQETHYMESHIDLESVQNGTNKRFTVMLRNVPNRYTEEELQRVLDLVIPGM